VERDLHLVSEIGQAAREAFGKVFEGWHTEADWPIKRTVEAQIAAASLGYKPLYWDPWARKPPLAFAFNCDVCYPPARSLVPTMPVSRSFRNRPSVPFLNSDPAFYRPSGESDLSAVLLVSRAGFNGELLGYGARSFDTPGVVPVHIFDDDGELFASFMSAPGVAERHARERLLDIATYTGADLIYTIG
jgi:hypothetical protein